MESDTSSSDSYLAGMLGLQSGHELCSLHDAFVSTLSVLTRPEKSGVTSRACDGFSNSDSKRIGIVGEQSVCSEQVSKDLDLRSGETLSSLLNLRH